MGNLRPLSFKATMLAFPELVRFSLWLLFCLQSEEKQNKIKMTYINGRKERDKQEIKQLQTEISLKSWVLEVPLYFFLPFHYPGIYHKTVDYIPHSSSSAITSFKDFSLFLP